MKKLLTLVVALLTAAALFISCSPSSGDNSEDGGSSGNSSSSGGSSSGSSSSSSSAIKYIFDKNTLTADCSEDDYDDFIDAEGNYKIQIVRPLSGTSGSEIIQSYTGEYTINPDTAAEHEYTKLSVTLYVKAPGIENSFVQESLKTSYEASGYDVSFTNDTVICTKADILDDGSVIPDISHTLYFYMKTCKTNADKSKIYLEVEGVDGEVIIYYLQRIK